MSQVAHLQICNRWMLFQDTTNTLLDERGRYFAGKDPWLVGYPYIDHTAGLSMHIWLFCKINFWRQLVVAAEVYRKHKVALIVRWDVMQHWKSRPLEIEE